MGCKQAEACQNNKKNNFMGNWFAWQCHPGERYKVKSFKNNFVEPSLSRNHLVTIYLGTIGMPSMLQNRTLWRPADWYFKSQFPYVILEAATRLKFIIHLQVSYIL